MKIVREVFVATITCLAYLVFALFLVLVLLGLGWCVQQMLSIVF